MNPEVQGISKDEVRATVKRMKSGEAVGPDIVLRREVMP